EADPLPSKRGEIGYREPEHEETPPTAQGNQAVLPVRHPADRDQPQADVAPAPAAIADEASVASVPTNHTITKSLLARLTPKNVPLIRGIPLTSILIFFGQIVIFIGTIAGWVLLTNHLSANSSHGTSLNGVDANNNSGNDVNTTQIFLHVAFCVAALAQLVFAERSIYHMRAQRWAHVHGSDLPMPGGRRASAMGIGFAPWNRPPLPTYAAALAQSGVGTGDVEDNVIAVPPPPAYGHTRGSTLVLSGMLTDAMREQKAQARALAIARANADGDGSVRESWTSENSRPMSYVSRDEEWEERMNASRAARLEETLARLDTRRPAA
ncbi:hypothetical protein BC835DRAFT_1231412, partial [Cytidiella melzeri]